jgi:protein-disulfide isomerase-like protein with CxxC motif
MDLQVYYKKIRALEESLRDPSAVLVSLETPDGGREGVRTEVPRRIAAKMIVEGGARLATTEEAREFQDQKAEAKRQADQLAAASRMQFAVISPNELRKLKGGAQPGKE